MKALNKEDWIKALRALDKAIDRPLRLLVVGGGAMVLAHELPLATSDIDAIPFKSNWTLGELDDKVKEVAQKLKISPDWLNSYFSSFSYVLPKNYDQRLVAVYKGEKLQAFALGVEDLLILKCFAGRGKDVSHAKYLMKRCKNLSFVEKHLEEMIEKNIPKAFQALDFFDEIKDLFGK
ncbi:MAG: DUF6036 family nucleotidyltransferase [Deltaproteobacteria bacterium]